MNKNIRAIILSFLLIAWFVISIGYVVSVQVDNEEFGISDSTETAQEWNERGISLGKSGEYKEAIECFDKAIELNPNYAMAYSDRGIVYEKLKKYERAIEDYNKAIALDPNYVKAYWLFAVSCG
jgi:tetratricopeptide (TPR) repeat protein